MFQVGDKVFYPMHGAGIIEDIVEKEFNGNSEKYCVINIPSSSMDVQIPMKNMEKVGLRAVVDVNTARDILSEIKNGESDCNLSWRQRYNANMEKIKSGQLNESAEVYRDLLHRDKEKALNSSERQQFNDARRLIISELSLIKNITEDQAADLLTS